MKPQLIVTPIQRDQLALWREQWNALTQEDRKAMTVPQLIQAMGPLHVNYPDHVSCARIPRPAIPLPNLAVVGRGPDYNLPNVHSFWGLVAAITRWAMR